MTRVKRGDILVVQSRTLIGRLISRLTNSPWNHAALVLAVKENGVFTLEATARKVELRLHKNFSRWKSYRAYRTKRSEAIIIRGLMDMTMKIGKSYAWLQTLGFLWLLLREYLTGRPVFSMTNPMRGGENCTELIFNYRETIKRSLREITGRRVGRDSLTPDDLDSLLAADEKYTTLVETWQA